MDNPNDPGGRRFAGSRELVDEYAGQGLQLRLGTDVEMELNMDDAPVRMKQSQIQQHVRQQQQRRTFHRQTLGSIPQHPSPFDSAGDGSTKRGWNHSAAGVPDETSPAKRRRKKDVPAGDFADPEGSSTVAECKKEVEEFVVDSDSEDGVASWKVKRHSGFNGLASGASFPDSENVFGPILATGNPFDSSPAEYPSLKVGLDIHNLRMKEQALSEVTNHAAGFVKGSVENKLLASTMYDAGKALTLTNPHPLGSEHFRADFQRRLKTYIDSFPLFLSVAVTQETTALITNNVKEYSPEAFLKMNMRNGHKRAIKALQKQLERNGAT